MASDVRWARPLRTGSDADDPLAAERGDLAPDDDDDDRGDREGAGDDIDDDDGGCCCCCGCCN